MFPLRALVLFRFALFLLRFPFGKLLLSLLALEKGLYLREQDTGQGFYLMVRYACAVVIGLLFPWHDITPVRAALHRTDSPGTQFRPR